MILSDPSGGHGKYGGSIQEKHDVTKNLKNRVPKVAQERFLKKSLDFEIYFFQRLT